MIGAKVSSTSSITTKVILVSVLFLAMFFLLLKSTFSPSSSNLEQTQTYQKCPSSSSSNFNKLPQSLSDAIIHYATTNITPQQTPKEISVTQRVLLRKSPCNFLVFGLGHDSLMWASLNLGGKTVFLEESESWISEIHSKFPNLESRHATYDTKVREWKTLLGSAKGKKECEQVVDPRESDCTLALREFPKEVYEVEWDLIMVDAPTGYHDEAPGRMQAIYTAGLLGRNREDGETDVFVHDVDRHIEDVFSKSFLCEGYMIEQQGRLRHFTIPSHRTRDARPFCPTNLTN